MAAQMFRSFILMLLRGYKRWISPLLGQHCRFHPSCSVYTMQAVERFGVRVDPQPLLEPLTPPAASPADATPSR